jgi:hypothetical protein
MKPRTRPLVFFLAGAIVLILTSCRETQSNKPQNTSPTTKDKTATGTIAAIPNPIKVCDKSGSGITTLTWTSNGTTKVEVHVGKPDGDLFAATESNGTWTTGKWVSDGVVFFLQDVSGGKALTRENTLATTTVNVTSQGCP